MTTTSKKCCCEPGFVGPCCQGGEYGYLLVRRVSEGVYERPPSLVMSASVPFYIDAPDLGFHDEYEDGLFLSPPVPATGEAELCDEEPTEPDGDIFRARWWRGFADGAVTHGPGHDRQSIDASVEFFVTPTDAIIFVEADDSPPVPPGDFTVFERGIVITILTQYRQAPQPKLSGFVRVRQRRYTELVDVQPQSARFERECEVAEIRGCLGLGTGVSAPIDADASGAVQQLRHKIFQKLCVEIGVAAPDGGCRDESDSGNWRGCPPSDFDAQPWEAPGNGSGLSATVEFSVEPETCRGEVQHTVADCETPSGVCVINGIVRAPECCQDPTLPGCQAVEFGPCCQIVTPTHWTFLPSTFLRMRAWFEIIQFSSGGVMTDLWFGDIQIDRPGGATSTNQCQSAQNSVLPNQNPGPAYHVVYPTTGSPTLANNTFQLLAALGRDAALPSLSARLLLLVTGEFNNTVVRHDSFASGAHVLEGLAGARLNVSQDRRFFDAQPVTAEPFRYAANSYLYTVGNPPAGWTWRSRIFAEAVAWNYARCAPKGMSLLARGPDASLLGDPEFSPLKAFLNPDGSPVSREVATKRLAARDAAIRARSEAAPRRRRKRSRAADSCCLETRSGE